MENEENDRFNLIEQMKSWQEDWVKNSEEFDKPQIIVDAKQEAENYRRFHETTSEKIVNKSNDSFATIFNNPQQAGSLDKDQDSNTEFVNTKVLHELNAMKLKLHELECQLNAAMGLGKKEDSLKKSVLNVRDKVDELSEKLGQVNVLNDRTSPKK